MSFWAVLRTVPDEFSVNQPSGTEESRRTMRLRSTACRSTSAKCVMASARPISRPRAPSPATTSHATVSTAPRSSGPPARSSSPSSASATNGTSDASAPTAASAIANRIRQMTGRRSSASACSLGGACSGVRTSGSTSTVVMGGSLRQIVLVR
jgi:hypothetical protein